MRCWQGGSLDHFQGQTRAHAELGGTWTPEEMVVATESSAVVQHLSLDAISTQCGRPFVQEELVMR